MGQVERIFHFPWMWFNYKYFPRRYQILQLCVVSFFHFMGISSSTSKLYINLFALCCKIHVLYFATKLAQTCVLRASKNSADVKISFTFQIGHINLGKIYETFCVFFVLLVPSDVGCWVKKLVLLHASTTTTATIRPTLDRY